MTPEDRDLLLSLRQQQAELQKTLERINVQLNTLESRHTLPTVPDEIQFPPIPTEPVDGPIFPPIPTHPHEPELPPIPPHAPLHPLPPIPSTPPPPPQPKPSFAFHFGRWLALFGAAILVLFFVSFAAWFHIYERMGPGGKLGLAGLVSTVVMALALRFERRKTTTPFFARTLLVAGLGGLYLTFYASHFVATLAVFSSSLVGGFFLLFWSLYVLYLAERRNSEPLAIFSIVLAFAGTASNPDAVYTLGANLILAATSVVFLVRKGWAALPAFAIAGTYLAVFRRLLIDDDGTLVLDTSRTLHFWPYAIYLYVAWFIFTFATIACVAPTFRGMKRLVFISLNNAGLAGLLALTAYIAGYGAGSIGWTLFDTGFVFLITSRFAGFAEIEPVELMSYYAAQGLALVTAGIVVIFSGLTRAAVLLGETFLLGVAGAFAGDRILTVATYVAAFFATVFSIWEIAVYAHHPWLLGFGGALIMLINAWTCRSEVRQSPRERTTMVFSTGCYCVLAIALVFAALTTKLNDSTLPLGLAFAALILTFAVYQYAIFELPSLAQFLLLAALGLVLFPAETGEDLAWWSPTWVALITLLLVTWWSRQRTLRTGPWKTPLLFIYALALVDLTAQAVHPWFEAQTWMVTASFLSFIFLAYGALTRAWTLAAAGQVFLYLALYHFFFPPTKTVYPWSWLAAAVPIIVTFATARAALKWLALFTSIQDPWRKAITRLAYAYKIVALLGLARWVFGIIPEPDQVAALFFLGTFVLSVNVRHVNLFGIRCSFFLSALGVALYFCTVNSQTQTLISALGVFLLICQPALLWHEGKPLVPRPESWALILAAAATGWLFVSAWVSFLPAASGQEAYGLFHSRYLALAWTLYAFSLFLFGLIVRERRFCRCGVFILLLAILRVFCYDFWGFSGGLRLLTLLVLAIAAMVVGFTILRRHNRSNTL